MLLKCLKKRKLNSIFPIILGEIKKKGKRTVFWPININESCLINQCHPEKEKILDNFEKKIFVLADGTLSIEDIILAIYKDSKREYRKKYIHKKCIDFFQEIFSRNWGLAFVKSWRSSYNRDTKIKS